MAFAIRDMEANLVMNDTNFNHRLAAKRNLEAMIATTESEAADTNSFINKINAYRTLAQADSDYFGSVTNYARSIAGVHFRKGSLLEYNGVYLTEGPLAGEGLLRCPPPCPLAFGRPVPGLWLYLSAGPQPRGESAILRHRRGRRRNADHGTGFGPGRTCEAAVGHGSGGAARAITATAGRTAATHQPGFHGRRESA